MKKLVLMIAVCLSAGVLFTQCGTKAPANQYTINGTVETNGEPAEAYLSYRGENGNVTDTAAIVDNAFVFIGTVDAPLRASLSVNYDLSQPMPRFGGDMTMIFIEPGTITVNSTGKIAEATIESPINNDAKRYSELSKDLNEAQMALSNEARQIPREEADGERMKELQAEYMANSEKLELIGKDFVAANPDSWFALAMIASSQINADDIEGGQNLLNSFSEGVRNTKAGQDMQARIDGWKATQVGMEAPDFTQNDPDGNPVKLSDFRGQYVLIDFWAAWCGPCRAENPHVVAAYNKFNEKGFTVLGVSLDQNRENWLKAIEEDGLPWTQVSDLKYWSNEVAKQYSINSIPANFLIDPNGVIVAKQLRGAALEEKLAELLGATE